MNKKAAERIQRYIKATASHTPNSEEIRKLHRTRSTLLMRIDQLRTRWKLPKSDFDRATDESEADHLEETSLAELDARIRELGDRA